MAIELPLLGDNRRQFARRKLFVELLQVRCHHLIQSADIIIERAAQLVEHGEILIGRGRL